MTRVCHLTYDMRIGGTEKVIANIIGNKIADIEHSILCLQSPLGPIGQTLQSQGVATRTLQWQGGFSIGIIKAIRAHCKAHRINVLHCHQYSPWSYGALACAGLDTKVIFTEHGRFYPDTASTKRKFINPILMRLTHYCTSISEATKRALIRYEYLPENQIRTLYNGLEDLPSVTAEAATEVRNTLGLSDDCRVLGTIARLDPIKNHEMMINAVAEIVASSEQRESIHLVIVGDGENRDKLNALIEQRRVQQHVTITGYQNNVLPYLANIDLFLLTSFSEGTSITLLEAMQSKKPCIVTDVGGNAELIRPEHGIIIDSDDEKGLIKAIDTYLNDNEKMTRDGEAAHAFFTEHFTARKMNERYEAIYEELITDD